MRSLLRGVFVYLCICVFVYLCICVFVYLCFCIVLCLCCAGVDMTVDSERSSVGRAFDCSG
jgi:hypothetical protein